MDILDQFQTQETPHNDILKHQNIEQKLALERIALIQ